MKDSPAASATLGQSLVKLKLSVFMLSAAIAGLGGILMATALGSVTSDNFIIFLSLALLMLTVVFGIGYVSGALFGGLLAGVGFGIVVATFNNLAQHHADLHGLCVLPRPLRRRRARPDRHRGRPQPERQRRDFVATYRPMARPGRSSPAGSSSRPALRPRPGGRDHQLVVRHPDRRRVPVLPVVGQALVPAAFVGEEELAGDARGGPARAGRVWTRPTPAPSSGRSSTAGLGIAARGAADRTRPSPPHGRRRPRRPWPSRPRRELPSRGGWRRMALLRHARSRSARRQRSRCDAGTLLTSISGLQQALGRPRPPRRSGTSPASAPEPAGPSSARRAAFQRLELFISCRSSDNIRVAGRHPQQLGAVPAGST